MRKILLTTLALTALTLAGCGGDGSGDLVNTPGDLYPENNDSNLNGATARCTAKGSFLNDQRNSQGGVFRGQRRDGVRTINWDARNEQTFDIFGMTDSSYGTARWTLSPPYRSSAQGKLVVSQNNSSVSVRSGLGTFVNLNIQNYNRNTEVDLQCISRSSFRSGPSNDGRMRCTARGGESERRGRDEYLSWNGGHSTERQIWRGSRGGETVVVRLKSPTVVEIEAANLDSGKTIRAQGTISEGLDFRYRGRSSRAELVVSCAPASK